MNKFSLIVIPVLAALSACGGGGSTTGGASYSDREAVALNLASDLESLGYSDPASLPFTTGEVRYLGAIGAVDYYGDRIIGDLKMNVRFADSSMSGTADNFIDSYNDRYTGSLAITNGFIDRTADTDVEYTFVADVDGVLSANGFNTVVDALMLGDFTGTSQQGMIGILDGTATTPGLGTTFLDFENTAFAAAK